MKDELVYIKSNYINYNFKRFGEYVNPSPESFRKAIEHKIYVPAKLSDTVRDNKKLLCSFLTLRVIGANTLMTFTKSRREKCIVLDIPVTRGMLKRNPNELAFLEAIKNFLSPYLTPQDIRKTHLQVSGVINYGSVFGIHYTVLVPPEIEKQLKKSELPNGRSYRIAKLQSVSNLDSVSQLCIKNYKEV